MTRIPRDLIRHLEWNPHNIEKIASLPQAKPVVKQTQHVIISVGDFTIDDLLNHGKDFYSEKKDKKGSYIGTAVALKNATKYVETNGVIASMPYFVAAKSQAPETHPFWNNWYSVQSEELVGVDKNGLFGKAGTSVVVTIHGGGILTHERIMRAYDEGLSEARGAKLSAEELDNALLGKCADGVTIPMYAAGDVLSGKIAKPFGRYGVVLPFNLAKNKMSGQLKKKTFMESAYVHARVGSLEHLEAFFDKAKDANGVGNYHRLGEMDPEVPEGRLLYVGNTCSGLDGCIDLNSDGRFVGVAPEARRARK